MSRLITNAIRSTSASADAITFDNSGKPAFPNGGAGKILQVLQVVKTDTQSTQSTSYGDVTGLSQAITTVAGSKVLCLGTFFFGSSAAYSTWFRLVRVDVDGSTNYPYLGDADSSVTRASAGAYNNSYNYAAANSSFNFLDTPSGAGSHTYKIQWKQGYSGGFTSYIGRDAQGSTDVSRGRVPSSLTLIEVAG
tara:strand:- start:234 stop:812 length:579 start_codon:yes stop_codon:yes gene_type:complete